MGTYRSQVRLCVGAVPLQIAELVDVGPRPLANLPRQYGRVEVAKTGIAPSCVEASWFALAVGSVSGF